MSKYDNILNLPHYELQKHKRMSLESRSAQFAPFAALTGYEECVLETARLTSDKLILSEEEKCILDEKLQMIESNNGKKLIKVIYFVKDEIKSGGCYKEYVGILKNIDRVEKKMIFKDKMTIKINSIYDIEYEKK